MRLAIPDFVSNSYFPAIAAAELGLFRTEGLDIHEAELLFPVTKAMEALRNGQIDFVVGAAHATLQAFDDWQGAKMLAAVGRHMYWFLVLRSDLGVQRGDVQAVKGLRIGAAPGVDVGLRGLLAAAGIDPGRDGVTIMPVPGSDQPSVSFGVTAAQALADGKLDGFWANGMGAEVAVRRGVGKIILDVRRGDGPPAARDFTFAALVTTDRLIAGNPAAVEKAMRGLLAAQRALRQDPNLATKAARHLFPPMESDLIAELILRDAPYYNPAIAPATAASLNGFARSVGLLDAEVAYEGMVATQFSHLWSPDFTSY